MQNAAARPGVILRLTWLTSLVLATVLFAGCAATPAGSTPPDVRLRVVATTTVLADLVAQAGGDLVLVSSIVPKNAVVETFEPSPVDAALLATADLVVMNGLGIDDWLLDLIESSAAQAPVVRLAEDLPGVTLLYAAGEGESAANPHLWLNVAYAAKYVDRIGSALAGADPARAQQYGQQAAAYRKRLDELDAWTRDEVETIPEQNRKVISFHEAFPYFAAAYGLAIVDTVVAAPGQEPSAGDIAALIDEIRTKDVRAIFAESQFPDDLTETIAQETGITVVTDLYNDSLGDPPADTYEGMIRWDVERIVAALR